jgi:hypothetical protein
VAILNTGKSFCFAIKPQDNKNFEESKTNKLRSYDSIKANFTVITTLKRTREKYKQEKLISRKTSES